MRADKDDAFKHNKRVTWPWEKLTREFYALTRSVQPFALFFRPLLPIPPSRSLKVSCCRVPVTLFPDRANLFCTAFALRKMREVISVHVGQAGVQIGNACCKFSKILPSR